MATFASTLLTYVSTILASMAICHHKWSLSATSLKGLRSYHVPEPPSSESKAGESAAGRQKKTKKDKRAELKVRQGNINLQGAEQLGLVPLPASYVLHSEFFGVFDLVMTNIVIFLVQLLASFLLTQYAGRLGSPFLGMLGALLLSAALAALAQVELFSPLTSAREKQIIVGLLVAFFVAAFALLLLGPLWLLDFQLEQAAQQMNVGLANFARLHIPGGAALPPLQVDSLVLALALAAAAAVEGAVLFTAAVRCARSVFQALTPPFWGRQYMTFSHLAKLLMAASLLLPLLVSLLWIKPLAEVVPQSLGVDGPQAAQLLALLQPGALLAWGLVQLLMLRPLVQSFLNSALVQWWSLKHGQDRAGGEARLAALIRVKVDVINFLICKVAVQALAPAAVVIACGAMVLAFGLGPAPQDQAAAGDVLLPAASNLVEGLSAAVTAMLQDEGRALTSLAQLFPPGLVFTVFGFLGWWAATLWSIFTVAIMTMYRVGVLS